jgi:hypothetical protein
MNSAIHQLSATQMQRDALRTALRESRLPAVEKPGCTPRRFALLRRLRPAFV